MVFGDMAEDKIHSFNKYSLTSSEYAFRDAHRTHFTLLSKNTSAPCHLAFPSLFAFPTLHLKTAILSILPKL